MRYLSLPLLKEVEDEGGSSRGLCEENRPFMSLPITKHQINKEKQIKIWMNNNNKNTDKSAILKSQKAEIPQASSLQYHLCDDGQQRDVPDNSAKNKLKQSLSGKENVFALLNGGRQSFSGERKETNDPREETNPKMFFGGDEHEDDTEEQKLKEDLNETEKSNLAEPQNGSLGDTPAAPCTSIAKMVESGELTLEKISLQEMGKAIVNELYLKTDVEKKNALNNILSWLMSLKNNGQKEGMMGRVDVQGMRLMPNLNQNKMCNADEKVPLKQDVHANSDIKPDYEMVGFKEQPIKSKETKADGLTEEPIRSSVVDESVGIEQTKLVNLATTTEPRINRRKRRNINHPQSSKLMKPLEDAMAFFKRTERDEDKHSAGEILRKIKARKMPIKSPGLTLMNHVKKTLGKMPANRQKGKGAHAIKIKKYKYFSLKVTSAPIRRHSGGQASGGGGASNFHGNGGSRGVEGSGNSPLQGNRSRKGSDHGRGDGQDDDDKDRNKYNVTNDQNSIHEVDQSGDRMPEATTPSPNYKWFRKKPDEDCGHGDPDGGILEALGLLSSEKLEFDNLDEMSGEILNQLNNCLVQCLRAVDNGLGQEATPHCYICPIITRLFHHFVSDVETKPGECGTCDQMFALMRFHLYGCCSKPSLEVECIHTLAICRRIHRQGLAYAERPGVLEWYLWDKLKELLCRLFNDVGVTAPRQPFTRKRPLKLSRKVSARGTLKGIPENDIANAPEDTEGAAAPVTFGLPSNTLLNQREDSEISQSDILIHNLSDKPTPLLPRYTVDNLGSNPTFNFQGCVSMPTAHGPRPIGDQLMSFEDRPTGVPGIGEVVYGTIHHLRNIAEHWTHMKHKKYTGEKFPRVFREEGIILNKHKDKLEIGKTRFQEGVQWQKMTPLGRGVSGRCYLAFDFVTECKFCVKEILITSFYEDELLIWSLLDHKYIVQLYGAIRCDTHIYILAELIDGGCLTEHINNQRELNRRLSKAVALRYFKQLLEVLDYLQENNVLHEDLKPDNILLRNTPTGEAEIVVADFGLARRIQPGEKVGKTTPIGSQTQWSPEKAASEGYDFRSDVWAAICVLVHIFNGQPPWVRRFNNAAVLHYVISNNSPPLEDMPNNVTPDIKQIIHRGWSVDVESRPFARDLLADINWEFHPTGDNLFSTVLSFGPSSGGSDTALQPSTAETQHGVSGLDQGVAEREKAWPSGHHRDGTGKGQTEAQVGAVAASYSSSSETTATAVNVADLSELTTEQGQSSSDGGQVRSSSWNNSDPQHIAQYIQDEGENWAPPTLLPNLPLFMEPVSEEIAETEANEISEGDATELSPHRGKIRSASSPNIFLREESPSESGFNSEDLFGSGSPARSGEMGSATLPVRVEVTKAPLQQSQWQYGEGHAMSHDAQLYEVPTTNVPTHPHTNPPHLHLDLGRPGRQPAPRSKLHSVPSDPAFHTGTGQSNVGGRSGRPYSASPTVRQGITALGAPADPIHISSRSSSNSAHTSGSSPRGTESQPTTPKSSTYDHQDREMQTIAKEMIQELLIDQQPNTPGIVELSQSLCSDEEEPEQETVPESFEEYQASLQPSFRQVQPENNGTLIRFERASSEELITQVRVRDESKEWYEIIVDIASPMIHSRDFRRFCVLHQDNSVVDMNAQVGASDITVKVVGLTEEEEARTWFIQDHKFHWN